MTDRSEPDFNWPVRVYYHDTDAGGVVYHASYLNFMERARTEWLRSYGYTNPELLKAYNVVFVVRSVQMDFLRPALLDDLLDVTLQIKEIGRSRLILRQTVLRGAELLNEAEVHLVCVSMENFKPVSVPETLRTQWKI